MKLIVGLGNPGKRYEKTRHNVGFWVIDRLSSTWDIPILKEKWKAIVGEGNVKGESVILMKPLTYMNLSGEAVRMAIDWLKLDIEDVLIIYDDLDISVGKMKLKQKGSSGGHNGIKSLIHHLKTEEFKRIKLGIGRPLHPQPIESYVLSSFREEEMDEMNVIVDRAQDAVDYWLSYGFLKATNQYQST
jgi:PTH1 family peptidyl-tRNA hydrolase